MELTPQASCIQFLAPLECGTPVYICMDVHVSSKGDLSAAAEDQPQICVRLWNRSFLAI